MRSSPCPSRLALVVALVVALGALGCTDFESIDREECGNGILEFGEDCDAPDNERCVACSVTCNRFDLDCASYGEGMEGFVCGADNLCHAPAGTFRAASEQSLPVDSFRITDIDKDGIGDVLVQSSTSVDVLYGKADGVPIRRVSLQSPVARGPASYGDLDGDGAIDLVLPTSDGIVAYTSTFGAPAPLPFASPIDSNMGEPHFVRGLSDDIIVIVGTRQDNLRLMVLDPRTEPQQILLDTHLCNALPAEIDPRQIDLAETPTGFVIAARIAGAMPARMCALRVERGAPWTRAAISPPISPFSRPLLYSVDGGCPSLFVTDAEHLVELVPSAPPCTFVGQRVFSNTSLGAVPLAGFPFEHPNAATTVGLVLQGGVFHIDKGALVQVYIHDRFVTDVVAADLDNDGLTDLVAGSIGNQDLDIYYRLPGLTTAPFRRYRYSTDGAIRSFVLGDFDGNQRADIAYVQAGTGSGASEQLAIAYGTSDLFLPGAIVGSFGTVRALLSADIPDFNDPGGGVIDDLVVLYTAGNVEPVVPAQLYLALLHGSPQRTMLSFFSPRADDQGRFRGAVAGRFVDPQMSLVAFEQLTSASGDPHVRMWQTSALSFGPDDRIPYTFAPQLGDCEIDKSVGFCIDGARYLAWPDRPGELDVLIGVDRFGRALALDPRQLNTNPDDLGAATAGQLWPADRLGEDEGPVRSMYAITVDATSRLLVARQLATGGGSVSLCEIDATGVASACVDLALAISSSTGIEGIACDDAAPARIAPASRFSPPRAAATLVVLCHTVEVVDPGGGSSDEPISIGGLHGLFRVSITGDTIVADPLMFLAGGEQVRVGDVNGDAVDDIVVVDRSMGVTSLQVHVQCTSRDVTCGTTIGPGIDQPVGGSR